MAQVTGRNAHAAVGPDLPERYAVVGMMGVGGMASIWAADDAVLGRRVAIKVLAEQFVQQPRFVERFQREARTAALLSGHPHVVTIYDVGEEGGRPFIVMEHLAGGSLAERMAARPAVHEEVLQWLRDAASALDFAHEKGVVHRDVKPRNLLFDGRGRVVVADFGIARAAFEDSLTVSGELLGTAAYISPEQALGQAATAASDRYALAVVAFEALTGGLPFGGGTLVEIAHRRTELDPPRASERLPGLPPAVDDVLLQGLARDPTHRWQTASAFVDGLEAALKQPRPAPPVTWSHPPRRFRLAPLLLGLAAIAVGLIVGLSVLNDGGGGNGSDRSASRAQADERAAGGQKAKRQRSQDSAPAAPAPEAPKQGSDPSGDASPAQLNDQGFAFMNAGDYGRAIPILQRAVNAFPEGSSDLTLAYALYNLGRSLRLAGRPAEAIPVLERRLQFNNQRGAVKKELAAAQRAAGGDTGGAGQGGGQGGGGGEEEGD